MATPFNAGPRAPDPEEQRFIDDGNPNCHDHEAELYERFVAFAEWVQLPKPDALTEPFGDPD